MNVRHRLHEYYWLENNTCRIRFVFFFFLRYLLIKTEKIKIKLQYKMTVTPNVLSHLFSELEIALCPLSQP